ncbi:hypothetical protein EVAR_20874_1 [Eumeta japonica]|uniref:Uncharacterized protein n=1 Tax=Eumeta variegata TaxID=151549 RepID=A0A4C1UXD5_EUMVA|nr:hypothetical protein EVAR_20874_1 [Eumeta japonica]
MEQRKDFSSRAMTCEVIMEMTRQINARMEFGKTTFISNVGVAARAPPRDHVMSQAKQPFPCRNEKSGQ